MGSHILDILRQGIWASLTGGWFYDPQLSIFVNTFHLYLWLFLLAFPLVLHLTLSPSWLIWGAYSVIIGIVFTVIKVFNYKLHHMFDTCEVIEEEVDKSNKKDGSSSPTVEICSEEPQEPIEMSEMGASKTEASTSETKHTEQADGQSERRKRSSQPSGRRRGNRESKTSSSRAPLAELDKDDIDLSLQGAVGGSNRILLSHHSNTEDEDDDTVSDPDDEASVPNTITTRADVEAEPSDCQISLPDDSLHSLELKSPSESKHSCDADLSDVSPEHVVARPKKPRRKAQRAKSALESSDVQSKHSADKPLRSRPSLPARPKLDSVINKDTGVSIIRPWSDQTICRTKQMLESDEIFVIGHDTMSRNAIVPIPERHLPDISDRQNSPSKHRGRPLLFHNCNPEFVQSVTSNTTTRPLSLNSDRHKTGDRLKTSQSATIQEDDNNLDKNSELHVQDKNLTRETDDKNTNKESSSQRSKDREKLSDKLFKRNAFSEDRTIEQETNTPKASSQPSMKVGTSFLSTSSDSDSDLSLGEVMVVKEQSKKKTASNTSDKPIPKSTTDNNVSKVKSRNKGSKADKKPRPNSAEFAKTNSFPINNGILNKTKTKINSSPTLNTNLQNGNNSGQADKPKDIGFARVTKMLAKAASERSSHERTPSIPSVPNSQQSSVMGLDWLFTTDSDSSDSQSHRDSDLDSLTVSSFDDSSYDNSTNNAVLLDYSHSPVRDCHDNHSDNTMTSPSDGDLDPDILECEGHNSQGGQLSDGEIEGSELLVEKMDGDINSHIDKGARPKVGNSNKTSEKTSDKISDKNNDISENNLDKDGDGVDDDESKAGSSMQSNDELETMRKQGAIPKHFTKPLPPVPEPTMSQSKEDLHVPDTKASSPASFDLSDPEEFHRKLIEILNEPLETSTEHLKKFMQLMETKKSKSSSVKSRSGMEDKSVSVADDMALCVGGEEDNIDDMETKSNESKPVTPTEISSLLPDKDEPRGVSRLARKPVRKRRHRGSDRSPTMPTSMLGNNSHIADHHDDTTEGATHLFQDEDGKWYSYTFGDGATGTVTALEDLPGTSPKSISIPEDRWSSSSCASGSMVVLDPLKNDSLLDNLPGSVDTNPPRGILQNRAYDLERLDPVGLEHLEAYVAQLLESGRRFDSSDDSVSKDDSSRSAQLTKHFYKFKVLPKKFVKIYFDRLALLALLDRNLSTIENLFAVLMAVLVGVLGALVLARGFYVDFPMFLFCFIMAGCQYSLMKSVQPDAASPMHGYNHLIVFSRPFYFCICCGLMLLLDHVSQFSPTSTVYVYGLPFTTSTILWFARDFLKVFLLCLPVIFTVGLLPQVNTFCMFVLEQLDTHILGGNATVSLISSVYCMCRSVLAAGFLYVICYIFLIQLGQTIVDEPDPCKNPEFAQTAAFSIFCALLVAISYHLSRSASDPSVLWMLIKDSVVGENKTEKKNKKKSETEESEETAELEDPLPGKMKNCVSERLQSDLLISIVIMILSFAIHVSTVFIQPLIDDIVYFTVAGFGFLIHYVIPQLRKEMPWLCCSHSLLRSHEGMFFEATAPAKIMWFEKLYIWLRFIERNGMYPVVVLCAITRSVPDITCKFGSYVGPLVIAVCSMKLLRFAFSNTPKQHMILAFTVLFFKYDMRWATETTLIDYFFIAILFTKFCDLYLKMKFIITYIAPWQITWGSAFHAFAQPFSVPHSAMLFLQAGVSAFFSTPLNPFLGSAIFITSYVRPVKFWEKDYNTKRVDHSNTRLSQQLERNTGADDNNLNSIFYEHLTRSLQHSLCGDLLMGRWGNAEQGDTFIMASDSLNALVHIIEMGNGLVTFQLRGLEFRGTYCQQREVEAITEGVEENEGFCCFEPGHLPHFLSLNAAFNQRWLSWEVVVTKYILEGYSISDNNAASMVGVFDFRKVLIMYYVQSIIYYTVRSPRLEQWLDNQSIVEALNGLTDEDYCDADVTFSVHVDDDYDSQVSGITRKSFCNRNLDWIQYCASRREKAVDCRRDSPLVSLCFALSLLGRRALGTASHNNASASVEFFLYGLHALFKGDFRITSPRDEWVFADMELLRRVVAPGVRMSLKLHQDHFLVSDAYETEEALYDAISQYETHLVISHEADPVWRNAVLSNTPSLLALRNVFDEGSDEYKIIMLNKRFLTFRIVKVNRECVRGLWAGQQQELIFLRNRNPERGSIQNAKQALRNMINSSCDQPIGYPIYVSPLTTSYSSTNEQYTSVIGGEFILANVKRFFQNAWQGLRRHCGASCTSGSSAFVEAEIPYSCAHQAVNIPPLGPGLAGSIRGCPPPATTPITPIVTGGDFALTSRGDLALTSRGNRGSLISTASSQLPGKRSMVTLAGLIAETQQQQQTKDNSHKTKVKINDTSLVYDNINLGRRIDVQWPSEDWRNNGGKNTWAGWKPSIGMVGFVVHRWSPCHREVVKRSHVDKTILLVQIGDKYVPIAEQGVMQLSQNTEIC